MGILGLTLDTSISITSIGGGLIVLIGVIGSHYSHKFKLEANEKKHEENQERFSEMEKRLDSLSGEMNKTNLLLADKYVKREDLRDMETRLRADIQNLEHSIRNIIFGSRRGRSDE